MTQSPRRGGFPIPRMEHIILHLNKMHVQLKPYLKTLDKEMFYCILTALRYVNDIYNAIFFF